MGRRVRKEVFIYDDGWPQDNDPDEQWHFVYDGWTLDTPRLAGRDGLHGSPGALPIAASQGWNVVMILDGLNSNAVVRKLTWGLDLSGSIHGAGGIGGLLACEEPQAVGDPKRYWFMYDANGNVTQVLDATDVNSITIAAHYEYDPYGNLIHSSGPYADANPFRFSTKWFDAETHLGYWGYRYYSPRLGRWISRDPIGDWGGWNLYVMVGNDPVDLTDRLGLNPGAVYAIAGGIWKGVGWALDVIGIAQLLGSERSIKLGLNAEELFDLKHTVGVGALVQTAVAADAPTVYFSVYVLVYESDANFGPLGTWIEHVWSGAGSIAWRRLTLGPDGSILVDNNAPTEFGVVLHFKAKCIGPGKVSLDLGGTASDFFDNTVELSVRVNMHMWYDAGPAGVREIFLKEEDFPLANISCPCDDVPRRQP